MKRTKLIRCECEHDYQDEKYAPGARVHNRMDDPPGWRCTVCGDEKRTR